MIMRHASLFSLLAVALAAVLPAADNGRPPAIVIAAEAARDRIEAIIDTQTEDAVAKLPSFNATIDQLARLRRMNPDYYEGILRLIDKRAAMIPTDIVEKTVNDTYLIPLDKTITRLVGDVTNQISTPHE
jgi:hypothetical protein